MPQWMLDEIDDRRHSRTDRSEWIRDAIEARLDAEDRDEWDEIAPEDDEREAREVETAN
jgi:metal-responsive CopG/Arc/MetJ family transcriptional regulator